MIIDHTETHEINTHVVWLKKTRVVLILFLFTAFSSDLFSNSLFDEYFCLWFRWEEFENLRVHQEAEEEVVTVAWVSRTRVIPTVNKLGDRMV